IGGRARKCDLFGGAGKRVGHLELPAARRTTEPWSVLVGLAFGSAGNQWLAFADLSLEHLHQGCVCMVGDPGADLHRLQFLGRKHLPDHSDVGGSARLAPLLLGLGAIFASSAARGARWTLLLACSLFST